MKYLSFFAAFLMLLISVCFLGQNHLYAKDTIKAEKILINYEPFEMARVIGECKARVPGNFDSVIFLIKRSFTKAEIEPRFAIELPNSPSIGERTSWMSNHIDISEESLSFQIDSFFIGFGWMAPFSLKGKLKPDDNKYISIEELSASYCNPENVNECFKLGSVKEKFIDAYDCKFKLYESVNLN